jgi:hypothetical protein
MQRHGAVTAEIDLTLFARSGLDHGIRLGHARFGAELLYEATYALVAVREPVEYEMRHAS